MIDLKRLKSEFQDLGLEKGDVVLLHSAYKPFGGVEGGPQTVIDALLAILSEEGTLIVPTFNFDFCSGKPFNIRTTRSETGVITEFVRKNPQSCRVFHPIYSFSILGKLSVELCKLKYKSSFGKNSIFGKLVDLNGKILTIGISIGECMTFFHHVEEMEGIDYRYIKGFTGVVTDETGRTYEDTFTMFVRDLDKGVMTAVGPMGDILEQKGVINLKQIGNATGRLMRARDVYKITSREMKKDPFVLYQITPKYKHDKENIVSFLMDLRSYLKTVHKHVELYSDYVFGTEGIRQAKEEFLKAVTFIGNNDYITQKILLSEEQKKVLKNVKSDLVRLEKEFPVEQRRLLNSEFITIHRQLYALCDQLYDELNRQKI